MAEAANKTAKKPENTTRRPGHSMVLSVPDGGLGDAPDLPLDTIKSAIGGGDGPCGPSLLYELVYDQIKEAGREDDPNLPQGIWQTSLKQADWAEVERLCSDALCRRSKDLQLAAWLLEALLHRHGFAGLAPGLRLIQMLCETFWEDLHPQIDDDDLSFRVAPIEWINEKLSITLIRIPVTAPDGTDVQPYCWVDWHRALTNENEALKHRRSKKELAELERRATHGQFNQSTALTPPERLQRLLADVQAGAEAAETLETWLDNKCADQAPSLTRFRKALADIDRLLAALIEAQAKRAAEKQQADQDREAEEAAPDSPEQPAADAPAPATTLHKLEITDGAGPIQSRDDAYRRLAQAADYLVEHDPHSPAPYLVRRAIEWSAMNLGQLLAELSKGGTDATQVLAALGLTDAKRPGGTADDD